MTRFILFQRDDCHLCDLALGELAAAGLPDFESVFIDDDETLEARYGTRVPVLRNGQDARELDWPFDAARVRAFRSAEPLAALEPRAGTAEAARHGR